MALEKSDVQGSGGSTQPLTLLRLQHGRELFEHIAVVLVEPGNLAAGEHLGFDGLGVDGAEGEGFEPEELTELVRTLIRTTVTRFSVRTPSMPAR